MLYSMASTYAVMALIELAARRQGRPVHVRELSDSTGIPCDFLAKLIRTLVKAGILNSAKGKKGGIQFARPPSAISIAEVVRAIEGKQALWRCLFSLHPCDQYRNCPLYPKWGFIRNQIMDFLENTSISELASKINFSCRKNMRGDEEVTEEGEGFFNEIKEIKESGCLKKF